MELNQIHIRDPFVLAENGTYYMYGTRAANFGEKTGGFDVYTSRDLQTWSAPVPVLDSARYGLNTCANWAPEVHRVGDSYFMFATFVQTDGLRGTFILRAESPMGPFLPHSHGAVTPAGWECLDGTLYYEDGIPYMVFCHEHTQIKNGTVCCIPLSHDLTAAAGEPLVLFSAASTGFAQPILEDHYVTDGPFLYKTAGGALYMIWSTFIGQRYTQCITRFTDGRLNGPFVHLPHLVTDNGGHGMIFTCPSGQKYLIIHSPNLKGSERPLLIPITERDDRLYRE